MATKSLLFYASWNKSTEVFNCLISFKSLKKKNKAETEVEVEASIIKIKIGKQEYRLTLGNIVVQPNTCRGLVYNEQEEEIQFSLKGDLLNQKTSTDDSKSLRQLSNQSLTVDSIERHQNKWFCGLCRQKILADCLFARVLPLPSENWADFTDMWFCCNHGCKDNGATQASKTKQLLPGTKECFVGDTYLLVARGYTNKGFVKVNKSGSVVCRRCGQQLGVVMETDVGANEDDAVLRLFLHSIVIKDISYEVSTQIPLSEDLDGFFSRLLHEQSATYSSYRFIIEANPGTPDQSVSTCLVWLLDANVAMFTSEKNPQQNFEFSVQQMSAIKILFKCQLCSSHSKRPVDYVTKSVISLWRKDNTVHGVTLPHPVLLQLLRLLVRNCKLLPCTQRYLNGFHVSFLRNQDTS
ncbi:E3 ubiquitin-protein ligase E3D-like isoform X2 [Dreissena polymorpha]|uniref:E3 ubiquitin-protein ligase E3D-like isoform X2 n=1 Tax=Dreissena polymorpha TaxID=45954 RepID=UPI0022646185|nr:E3 ubiquitin-protein ligase E3D-like isoform X2 [Dreissena polymorpha]